MRYRFFAPIANAGGHFRSIKVPAPFRIERWTYKQVEALFLALEGPGEGTPDPRIYYLHCIPEGGKVGHVITGEAEIPGDVSVDHHQDLDRLTAKLYDRIRTIRLLVASQITLSASYWYSYEGVDKTVSMFSAVGPLTHVESDNGTVSHKQALRINEFVQTYGWPPSKKYVELALDYFDESFRVHAQHLRLVSLITSLEILFNTGTSELRQRVSRSAAVLLGNSVQSSEYAYDTIRVAYDVRSKVVHTGSTRDLKKIKFWFLQNMVADAIRRCWKLDMDKVELAKELNKLGFGSASKLGLSNQS